jgi:LmbE family N-acetylglucosaminyl deacetylase
MQRTLNRALHYFRPLVPPVGWEVLQTMQSFSRGGPLVALPAHRRVLVLSPHPDDEVIGCGGTTALLAGQGVVLRTVIATSGQNLAVPDLAPAEVAAARRDDAQRASSVLGASSPIFLGFEDGDLARSLPALSTAISDHVADFRPQAIYAPWLLDAHPDHQALAAAVARAAVPAETEVWGYEVWAAVPVNRLVDVEKVWDLKERAMAEHRTPAAVFGTAGHLALNRWRSVHGSGGTGHMEAFLALHHSTYRLLAQRLEERVGSTRVGGSSNGEGTSS